MLVTIISVIVIVGILIKIISSIWKNGITIMFKKNIVPILIVCTLLVIMVGYVIIGSINIKKKTWEYLESKGYQVKEIQSLEVNHSFLNILLSYDEWKIKVIYTDEPASTYSYRYVDGEIVEGGVSGTTNKEDLKH